MSYMLINRLRIEQGHNQSRYLAENRCGQLTRQILFNLFSMLTTLAH